MTALIDTSFLYALLVPTDRQHIDVAKVFSHTVQAWLMPTQAITEVAHLLGKYAGPIAVAQFLENLHRSQITLLEPIEDDYLRAAQLIRQYRDAPLDLVDALIVAAAERLNITTVLTLDRRHFHSVRPRHCAAFRFLP